MSAANKSQPTATPLRFMAAAAVKQPFAVVSTNIYLQQTSD